MNSPSARLERKQRTVFVSLPDEPCLQLFYEEHLLKAVEDNYKQLKPISYLKLRQGRWMPQLEKAIAHCNAVIAFIKGNNINVMLEVGRAISLGKPIILVAPRGTKSPSMLSDHQIIYYNGSVPSKDVIEKIMEALELAVFAVLQREKSDERTKIQKRLLLGSKRLYKHHIRRAEGSKKKIEVDILAKARDLYYFAQFDKVIRVLNDWVTEHRTKNEEIFHLLADSWFLKGEASASVIEAITCYEMLLRVSEHGLAFCPGSFLLRKDIGIALVKLGRFADAEAQFNQLLSEQDFSILHYDLACVNALMGNKMKALSSLERAIQMESYYQELARVDHDFDPIWEDAMFQALVFQHRVF